MRRPPSHARGGFTLIEMLAVVMLTAIVLTVAIDFYLDLSRASQAAVDRARTARRAAVLLDRVARDLQAAVLVRKPEALDPLAHPWVFLAEAGDPDAGADRLKFVSRGRRPRADARLESDLEMVAWMLADGGDGGLELVRWSSPQLPDALDRSFPPAEETDLVAGDVSAFGVRLLADDGSWVGRWDSSQLAGASELPLAAEISVTLLANPETGEEDGPYVRRVLLPLRPLDLEAQLEADAEDGAGRQRLNLDTDGDGQPDAFDADGDGEADAFDEDGDGFADEPTETADADEEGEEEDEEGACVTVSACVARFPGLLPNDPGVRAAIQSVAGQCARNFASTFPGIPAECLQ